MEPNFQTSFIPKKPIVREHATPPRSVGFFTVISVLIVFTVLVATGGLYFYKELVTKNIANMQNALSLARNRFEPAKIAELKVLDKRLAASSEILSKHIAITPIFEALQAVTMKTVQYTEFNYDFGGEGNGKILVHLSGVATSYSTLALQSDLFATKNKNIIDPVFSNLSLNENGQVTFDLDFAVDPSFIDYKIMLLTQGKGNQNVDQTLEDILSEPEVGAENI